MHPRRTPALLAMLTTIFASLVFVFGTSGPAAADTGGYPYYNAVDCSSQYGPDSWCINGYDISPLGYGYRNCTDYAAWKLSQLGVSGTVYKGLGNANTWASRAPSHGATVNSTPSVGAIASSTSGTFGHVAYVTKVSGSTVYVAEYNKHNDGTYGTRSGTMSGLGFTSFIHFNFKPYWTSNSPPGGKV